jgi:hypothetical protein
MKMAPKNWRLAARPSGSRPGGDVATTGLGLACSLCGAASCIRDKRISIAFAPLFSSCKK